MASFDLGERAGVLTAVKDKARHRTIARGPTALLDRRCARLPTG